jgi:hypothetical protein
MLAKIADRIALTLDTADPATVRDACDLASGGGLDCFQLDLLTDMTVKRIVAAKMFREQYRIEG